MLAKKLKIHFIGIGGIGVSALAKYYIGKGHRVSGSDLLGSEITEAFRKKGIKIFIGKEKPEEAAKKFDLVIYSPAISVRHPMSNMLSYPQALGQLTKQYFTIAVSGTHGKSTTTAMIALLLVKAGLDPTVIVGTKLKEFKDSNCRVGKSQYLVIEADEHFASFLNYWPKIIVLTNIEEDHLDYYKNLKNILRTFKKYVSHLPKDGILAINNDDKNIRKMLISNFQFPISKQIPIKKYSIKQPEAKKLKNILKVPGEHNIYNALAALSLARILKIPDRISFKALSGYKGAWRRFETKQITWKKKRITLISDYGHHPTKVRVTLKAAREKYPKKKIWCVYQPHQYQRTYYLFKEFTKVFRAAPVDGIIITDIFDVAGREETKIKKKVSSEKLVEAVKKKSVIYLPKDEILNHLKENLGSGEVLIIMGAGDIYKLDKLMIKPENKNRF